MLLKLVYTFFLLFLVSGCGKQLPRETAEQKAERIFAEMSHKYHEVSEIVLSEQSEKRARKKVGKVVEQAVFKKGFWDYLDDFNGGVNSAENIPFHHYQKMLEADENTLNKTHRTLVMAGNKKASQVTDLLVVLHQVSKMVTSHKAFKQENRYLSQVRAMERLHAR